MLTDIEIVATVESSFKPYNCVAEIFDYRQKLRLNVRDQDGRTVAKIPNVVLSQLREKSNLIQTIDLIRSHLRLSVTS